MCVLYACLKPKSSLFSATAQIPLQGKSGWIVGLLQQVENYEMALVTGKACDANLVCVNVTEQRDNCRNQV